MEEWHGKWKKNSKYLRNRKRRKLIKRNHGKSNKKAKTRKNERAKGEKKNVKMDYIPFHSIGSRQPQSIVVDIII